MMSAARVVSIGYKGKYLIIYVGMDAHTANYMLCCYRIENDFFPRLRLRRMRRTI